MQPHYRVMADSKDVTAALAARLLSLSITDAAGMDSDTLEITLDDRDGSIAIPRTGAELDVSLGYKETGLARMGLYVVDEVVLSGPPASMTIRARAANLRQSLKSNRTRSWDSVTIGGIVTTIAQKHGYQARVAASLAKVSVAHIDQTDESDLHFLTRLAKEHGAVSKVAGGLLLFVPVGETKSASGKTLPPATISRQQLQRYDVTYAERGKYASVQARWDDKSQAKELSVTVGSGDPVKVLARKYADAAAARSAAQAELDKCNRGVATLSLSCAGDPRLAAESSLTLSGVRGGIDGTWKITQVSHRYDGQGYSCDVEAERK